MPSFEYSVIRYVDDIAINEPINIGIMIGKADTKILVGKLIDDVSLIRKIHKKANIKLLESVIKTLRGQQEYDNTLSMMAKKFQYQLRFTEPRAAITDNKEKTLNDLYERYVSIVKNFPVRKTISPNKINRDVKKHIGDVISELKFNKNNVVEGHKLHVKKRSITVDYLFKNGKMKDVLKIFPINQNNSRANATLLATDYRYIRKSIKDVKFHVIVHDSVHDSNVQNDDKLELIAEDFTTAGLEVKKLKEVRPCLEEIRKRIS